ncbi:MAG TPA: hypothetical protein VE860_08055 [Chthoniobacterales bacterium]|nr:hypothetical protein [Chthoniobacterales bacterium]
MKASNGFSEAEVQKLLKEASRVTWERTEDSGQDGDELNRTGSQNGKVIFDANEGDNGRGTWFLTIKTR